jgi:acyl carrier protein
MKPDDTRAVILAAIGQVAPEVDPDDLGPDEEIWFGLDLDSMDQLQIMEHISTETGIEVPEADYPKLQTIDDLVGYLSTKVT